MKNDRKVLRADAWTGYDFGQTDQSMGVKSPDIAKAIEENAEIIDLPKPEDWKWQFGGDLTSLILERRSIRKFNEKPLSLEELSYLLWSTQAVRKKINNATSKRFVPSAGSRHALETYLAVLNVTGLKQGIYRYLPVEHKLLFVYTPEDFKSKITVSVHNQIFCTKANVVFYWSAIPYRMEWRYEPASSKLILLDAGHVCQDLYLATGAIDCGMCAIAAYDQKEADSLCRIDGENEMVVYIAPVGKKDKL